MDDYLPKPFDLVKLRRKLGPWLTTGAAVEENDVMVEAAPVKILDADQLGECMAGDLELDRELIRDTLDDLAVRRAEMQKAFLDQDDSAWKASAHRAVGTSATLGFVALAAEFRVAEHDDGEKVARNSTLQRIDALLPPTREALAALGLLPLDSAMGNTDRDHAFGFT